VTTRFAPSPTGWLHLGHAFSAWFAREEGDRRLLRIEDLDAGRIRPEFEAAILEDLDWLGLRFDGEIVRQSQRLALYKKALETLRHQGVIYPCFCTRSEIAAELEQMPSAPHGPDGLLYPGRCRGLSKADIEARIDEGREPAWRLDLAEAMRRAGPLCLVEGGVQEPCRPEQMGDVILGRKDAGVSYHLCVVVDDADQGVDLVTRGEDLRPSAHLHRLLQALLELPEPQWRHHPLVRDDQGRRLAKRHDALSIRSLRESGVSAREVMELAVQASSGSSRSGG
jgi:glutamyl-Q tRNA(Asp) synthetase